MDKFLKRLLEQGVAEQVFPGAAAAVACGIGAARRTSVAFAGLMDCRDQSAVTAATLFDLASLSKALSTALIFYSLFAEGRIRPDDTLAGLLHEEVPPDKRQISVRSLLSHSSGLAAYQPWFRDFKPMPHQDNTTRLFHLILNEPLACCPPASHCLYSDLGFMLLGQVAEELTGQDLALQFRERIARPLCLENALLYHPGPEQGPCCAATEHCLWRGRTLRGEVHDEHCWLLGGKAGHAGLFGTVSGVLRLCGAILDAWKGKKDTGCAWTAFVPQGLQRQLPGQTWCLGFDTPSAGASSSGRYFAPSSVGHLGFTGTSFWIDPAQELIVVLLSNRVHPSRENTRIRQFRPQFHDAVVAAGRRQGFIAELADKPHAPCTP